MLYVIPMITTKIFLEKTQKEMRRKQKCTTTKKSTKPKARQSRRKSGTEKPCKTQGKKDNKMSKVKSSPNSNYFICKYIKLSIQRHRLAEWGNKNRIQLYVICENAFKFKNAHRLQAKG